MMKNILNGINIDPFEPIVYKLRVPLCKGEVEYNELTLRPPCAGDILMTDGHAPESVAYFLALPSSLSGVPLVFLKKIVPEDYADLRIILSPTNARFTGHINLLDTKEETKTEDPTKAEGGTPPRNSGTTSAE